MATIIGEYINMTNWVNIIEPESKIDHVNLEFPMTAQNWTWVIRRQFDSSTNNHWPNFTNIDKCNDKLNKPSEENYQELLFDEMKSLSRFQGRYITSWITLPSPNWDQIT
jgi:hypothetical protein